MFTSFPRLEKNVWHRYPPIDCQKVINKLADDGKTRTAVIVFNLMNKAFRKGVELGYLVKNPMQVVTKPRDRAKERPALSIEQAVQFLETAEGDSQYALLAFLTLTGARPEEAFGVRWDDVNFEKKIVSFRRAVKRIPGGGWEFDELKTTGRESDFPMTDQLVEILRAHRRDQAKLRLAMGEDWIDNHLVFTTTKGGPADILVARRHLDKILKQAGLPKVRLYDLRHSFGSALLESGQDIKTVSRLMRHASINTTARYVHGHAERDRQAVDRLGEVFSKGKSSTKEEAK